MSYKIRTHGAMLKNGDIVIITRKYIKFLQVVVYLISLLIVVSLFTHQEIGLLLLWDVVIPLAPLLLCLTPSLWRNICPMAHNSYFGKFLFQKHKKILPQISNYLYLSSIILLFLLVPLRHVGLNTQGHITGVFLITVTVIVFLGGAIFDSKSFWCSGLCPIRPVSKIYGINAIKRWQNSFCHSCNNCAVKCTDISNDTLESSITSSYFLSFEELAMIGAFPGFIIGWFLTPDYQFNEGIKNLATIYLIPFVFSLITATIYAILKKVLVSDKKITRLKVIFISSSISAYYSMKVPSYFNFSPLDGLTELFSLRFSPVFVMQILIFASFSSFFTSKLKKMN